jgi:hypothetical protein
VTRLAGTEAAMGDGSEENIATGSLKLLKKFPALSNISDLTAPAAATAAAAADDDVSPVEATVCSSSESGSGGWSSS